MSSPGIMRPRTKSLNEHWMFKRAFWLQGGPGESCAIYVCLCSNQLVAKAAVSYKLCASTKPHSHSAGFDAGMGPWDNSWKALKRPVDSGGLLQPSVGGSTYQRPQQPKSNTAALEYRPDPMARDAVGQWRLLAEPKTPFLHQMYS